MKVLKRILFILDLIYAFVGQLVVVKMRLQMSGEKMEFSKNVSETISYLCENQKERKKRRKKEARKEGGKKNKL